MRKRLTFERLDSRIVLDGNGLAGPSDSTVNLSPQHDSAYTVGQQDLSTYSRHGAVASDSVSDEGIIDIAIGLAVGVPEVTSYGATVIQFRDAVDVVPGSAIAWSVSLRNLPFVPLRATTEATNLEIAIDLPPEVTFVRFGGDGNYDVSTGIWAIPAVGRGEPVSATVQGIVDDDLAHGTLLEAAAELVAVDQRDFDSSPNNDDGDHSEDDEAGAVATISNTIDLELTASGTTRLRSAFPDEPFTWNVQVTNDASATATATGVSVSTPLPDTVDFVEYATANGTFDPLTHTWTLLDGLMPGETADLEITTVLKPDVPGGRSIKVESFVASADQPDSDSIPGDALRNEDDTDDAEVRVKRVVDIELAHTADVDDVRDGDVINFTLALKNNELLGNYSASNIRFRHKVFEGLKFVNANTSGGGVWLQGEDQTGTTWGIHSLALGETVTVNLQFEVSGSVGLKRIASLVEIVSMGWPDVDADSRPDNFEAFPREDDEHYLEIAVAPQLSISGFSYLDANNDGVFQQGELPIRNTQIKLDGFDRRGRRVERSSTTNHWGYYQFSGLTEGNYQISQKHSPRFLDGIDSFGNLRGSNSVNDRFLVHLTASAKNYNFGERGIHPAYLNRNLAFKDEALDAAIAATSDAVYRVSDADANRVTRGAKVPSVPHRIASVDQQYSVALENLAYFPSVAGTSARMSVEGDTVIAVGTDGDDIVELQLGDNSHTLSLNGVRFEFDAAHITTFHVGGSTGHDGIIVRGTHHSDTASVLGERGEFTSTQYSVHTYSFGNTTFSGGGGYDYGQLYGSLADDVFESLPSSSTMFTPKHQMHMADFDRVDAYGRDGNDQVLLYGTQDADHLRSTSTFTVLSGPEHRTKVKGFERIDAYGRGGLDSAWLYGSSADEQFISTQHYASTVTSNRKVVAKDFESVIAFAVGGGTDLAYLYHLSRDDRLSPRPEYFLVERWPRVEAIHDYQLALVDKPPTLPLSNIGKIGFAVQIG